ncbi:twin-arginine translocase TatA/TatE family subunit [Hypericibacter sp.]|uniref:twin-arginine translocase TatA/TatE family subunit n=1 Tax=Hypericibacter sp. TaxID=2705401 RepID=UPI003D6CB673
MGSISIWHWLIVLAVVLVLFGGGGKIPKLMRDMGQGITAFKKGLKEEKKEGDVGGPSIENADASVPKDKAAS